MAACSQICKYEFKVRHFLLQHENPQTFVQFQFGHQSVYLAWRLFWAIYHIGWMIGAWVDWVNLDHITEPIKWLILLTNWAYVILTVSTIVDASVVLYVFVRRDDVRKGECTSMPWYMQMSWCLFTLGNVASATITVGYWAFVYKAGTYISVINVAKHVLNTVYVLLNLCVTGTPMRLLHFWFPVIFGVVYTLFTLFYYLAEGTNHINEPFVYEILDWSKPGMATLYGVIIAFVLVPVVHGALFGIHCLKILSYSMCHGSNEQYALKGTTSQTNYGGM